MVLDNPDEGSETWEESLDIAISGMSPTARARLEADAQASGCSVQEAAEAALARYYMEDGQEPHDCQRAWQRHCTKKYPWLQ